METNIIAPISAISVILIGVLFIYSYNYLKKNRVNTLLKELKTYKPDDEVTLKGHTGRHFLRYFCDLGFITVYQDGNLLCQYGSLSKLKPWSEFGENLTFLARNNHQAILEWGHKNGVTFDKNPGVISDDTARIIELPQISADRTDAPLRIANSSDIISSIADIEFSKNVVKLVNNSAELFRRVFGMKETTSTSKLN
jgi:hypothetical protein